MMRAWRGPTCSRCGTAAATWGRSCAWPSVSRPPGTRSAAVAPTGLAGRLADAGVDLVGAPRAGCRVRPTSSPRAGAAGARRGDRRLHAHRRARRGRAAGSADGGAGPHALHRAAGRRRPHPIGMAGPVEATEPGAVAAGLAPLTSHGDLLAAVDLVMVAAPRAARRARRGARQRGVRRARCSRGRAPTRAGRRRRDRARSSSCRWARPATPRWRARAAADPGRAGRPAGARVRDRGRLRGSDRGPEAPVRAT